jgi:hypothetical protein
MDVSAVSAVTSVLQAAQAQDTAGADVLRNALMAEQVMASELVQAINIPGLGENIDLQA